MRKHKKEVKELILGLVLVVVAFATIFAIAELHEYLMLKSMD